MINISGIIVKHFKYETLTEDQKATNQYLYTILGYAKHTETGEPLVVYKQLYKPFHTFARPASMFVSKVDREKYPTIRQEYRFEPISLHDVDIFHEFRLEVDLDIDITSTDPDGEICDVWYLVGKQVTYEGPYYPSKFESTYTDVRPIKGNHMPQSVALDQYREMMNCNLTDITNVVACITKGHPSMPTLIERLKLNRSVLDALELVLSDIHGKKCTIPTSCYAVGRSNIVNEITEKQVEIIIARSEDEAIDKYITLNKIQDMKEIVSVQIIGNLSNGSIVLSSGIVTDQLKITGHPVIA